jgi:hypothetical protein
VKKRADVEPIDGKLADCVSKQAEQKRRQAKKELDIELLI